jgi:uncharacterized protein with ATP-grasp and redox domains
MKSTVDCLPCFLRQALDAARMVTDDPAVHEEIMRRISNLTAGMDLTVPPPMMSRRVHQLIRELTEIPDPYQEIKRQYNRLALQWLPEMRERVRLAEDPFRAAVLLAIAGNIIDFGVDGKLPIQKVRDTVERALHQQLDPALLERFRQAIQAARSILYLGDNAGEIVFDRLLLEQMPTDKITFVVKGSPIINDATMEDAVEAGLTDMVRVIDNGSNSPGTVPQECSSAFRAAFELADLIVAKGQGNFETLNETAANLFFLFQAKCQVVARYIGKPIGTFVLCRSDSLKDSVRPTDSPAARHRGSKEVR